ncbi:MAG: acylphosphatase [Planctomycetes bacterium]|nr:acylphosphatase [Planctomycetota bacterium]
MTSHGSWTSATASTRAWISTWKWRPSTATRTVRPCSKPSASARRSACNAARANPRLSPLGCQVQPPRPVVVSCRSLRERAEVRRVRFLVRGRVQGVAFRAFAQREAGRLGITGFIRNRDDGAVEGEAQGTEVQLAEFERWLGSGPQWARVDRVEAEDLAAVAAESAFEVRR